MKLSFNKKSEKLFMNTILGVVTLCVFFMVMVLLIMAVQFKVFTDAIKEQSNNGISVQVGGDAQTIRVEYVVVIDEDEHE